MIICFLVLLLTNKSIQNVITTARPTTTTTIATTATTAQPTTTLISSIETNIDRNRIIGNGNAAAGGSGAGGFFEIIAAIFCPTSTTTMRATTTSSSTQTIISTEIPQRECQQCKCGEINTIKRIVGGQETMIHQYPWMAMLLQYGRFYCGASLINDLYVATAAHCVNGFNLAALSIRLLEHNRKSSSENIIERKALWFRIHDKYSQRTYDNDIALIRLTEAIEFNDLLKPVCMPIAGNSYAGQSAIGTGWGVKVVRFLIPYK